MIWPLPMPRRPSTTTIARFLASDGILQSVVHHDDVGAGELRQFRAGDAVARDDSGRKPRQQQRLVADVGGAMDRRIDPHRSGKPPAIAAAQKERPRMGGVQELRDRDRGRRLAGAADGEIAEANDRQAGAGARARACAEPPPRHRSRPSGEQKAAGAGPPPEVRLAQSCQRLLLEPKLQQIRIERGERALERAAELFDGCRAAAAAAAWRADGVGEPRLKPRRQRLAVADSAAPWLWSSMA